jgi:hypothetical protein
MRHISQYISSYYAYFSSNYSVRKKLFLVSVGFFVLQLVLYCMFLAMTVFEVVARKGIEEKNRVLASQVSTIEEEYVRTSREVDSHLFQAYGLVEAHNSTVYLYPDKNDTVGMLDFSINAMQ